MIFDVLCDLNPAFEKSPYTFGPNPDNVLIGGNITEQMFKEATGYDPIQDDLERCNCPIVGVAGHSCCGWNKSYNKPVFMVGTGLIVQ